MSQASQAELLMLELINEERVSRGLDPLAINDRLNEASEDHSAWMLETGTFSHQGENGSSHRERIEDASYALEGSWRTAENIGWQSERGAPGIEDDVRDIHAALMASPGHRANLLNPELEDIGIGIEEGDFQGFEAVMITQNFGTSAAENGPVVPEAPSEAPDVPVAEAPPPVDTEAPGDGPDLPVAGMDPPADPAPVAPAAPTPSEPADAPSPAPFDFGAFFGDVFEFREPVAPAASEPAPESAPAPVGLAGLFEDLFALPIFDERAPVTAPDAEGTTGFEGRMTVNGETVTTDDRAEFDLLLSRLLEGFGDLSCGMDLQLA